MLPVVRVNEMRATDAASPVAEEELIARAGYAVAIKARAMMGGTYGRRVVVVAGAGNNGADGRVAAEWLARWGALVTTVEAHVDQELAGFDLVIDAAYGTGFHGDYQAPEVHGPPILAVDIASGVDGDTGVAVDGAVQATATITFGAHKPGHFYNQGPSHCGAVTVADIGLHIDDSPIKLIEDDDLQRLPSRSHESHKWRNSVAIIAGSPGMMGAAILATRGAQRAGASAVRLMAPCQDGAAVVVAEALTAALPSTDWTEAALDLCQRAQAVVIGPGLGRSDSVTQGVHKVVAALEVPVICDADALYALSNEEGRALLRHRRYPTIVTPHDQEFQRLSGDPGVDRVTAVGTAARDLDVTVLLKGSTTTVASPDGRVFVVASGSSRLATAGSGDVLSGVIAAFTAMGTEPALAAALGAHVHGRAASRGRARGLIAGDLPDLIADVLSD